MGKYFGTDGFRGEANLGLTAEHAFRIGRFLGWYYGRQRQERPKVVIGKDTRRSSYMLEACLAGGLTASGADAYLLHVTTTPSVSYVTRTEDFECGIMITASHNPFHDNGIKIINSNGEKMEEELLTQIESYLDGTFVFPDGGCEPPYAVGDRIGCTVDHAAGRNRYTGYLISLATRSFKTMRVGLDCANGSSCTIAPSVFNALGAKTYVINDDPNGLNVNENAGSTHIEVLRKFVLDNGLDCGFAYDGDADRCIAVAGDGRIVDGDLILYLCGRYMKENGELWGNRVVTTVMSNLGLYKAFDAAGIEYEKTKVGDKYVYENMVANGYCIGGEQSGHVIFSKHATTGDGILTSLKIMEVMLEKKQSLSDLVKEVRIYPQVLKNVRVQDKAAAQADPAVQKAVDAVARELGEDGRILVRESGTEPLIRVMVEAGTEARCGELVDRVISAIAAAGHTV